VEPVKTFLKDVVCNIFFEHAMLWAALLFFFTKTPNWEYFMFIALYFRALDIERKVERLLNRK
jgi:hypothetical protein